MPPIPNELTPARRGSLFLFHSRSWLFTKNGLFSKSIPGFGLLKLRLGGNILFFKDSNVLISPVTPAAESRCPILVLTEPTAQNPFWVVFFLNAPVNASISIGSPKGVPVPCASMYVILSGDTPAFSCAFSITFICPSTRGAVYPIFEAPSLFIAEPLIMPIILSPSATASSNRFNTTTPAPFPPTVPLEF
ncbi:MAG: hypothetical protein BWY74_03157 [Firmicutes bacterium ADurb.Bin419]|nr:MAG: hypothetical protein BWY74_03157 [Firmicutes bacterium ADurb.Bin419]